MRVIAYLDGKGALLCADRCADRDFAEMLGQKRVGIKALNPADACDGCGTPVFILAAMATGAATRSNNRANARELVNA